MKVLFTSTPGTGHIHPLVPLAVVITEVADTRLLGEDGHVIDAGNDRGGAADRQRPTTDAR